MARESRFMVMDLYRPTEDREWLIGGSEHDVSIYEITEDKCIFMKEHIMYHPTEMIVDKDTLYVKGNGGKIFWYKIGLKDEEPFINRVEIMDGHFCDGRRLTMCIAAFEDYAMMVNTMIIKWGFEEKKVRLDCLKFDRLYSKSEDNSVMDIFKDYFGKGDIIFIAPSRGSKYVFCGTDEGEIFGYKIYINYQCFEGFRFFETYFYQEMITAITGTEGPRHFYVATTRNTGKENQTAQIYIVDIERGETLHTYEFGKERVDWMLEIWDKENRTAFLYAVCKDPGSLTKLELPEEWYEILFEGKLFIETENFGVGELDRGSPELK